MYIDHTDHPIAHTHTHTPILTARHPHSDGLVHQRKRSLHDLHQCPHSGDALH